MTEKQPFIRFFIDEQMASITESFPTPDGRYGIKLISKGMTRQKFEDEFPPWPLSILRAIKVGDPIPTFNMALLIRSLIVENFIKIGLNRERGNVRHFFYTNIIYTLTTVMGVTNIDSLNTALNTAWKAVIESGLVTYEGMNIESAKNKILHSFVRHSPFSNIIICVEKERLLKDLSWIAELFKTSIITAGGQPSRATNRYLIRSQANWKRDLDKPFYLLSITDLDPAGWYIQNAFKQQIENAIKFYNNGKGEVKDPLRLFLTLDQVNDDLLHNYAISAKDKGAKTERAIKASQTKVEYFKQKLGPEWERLMIDGTMMKVELEAIKATQMEQVIISELLRLIDDHSLILIPEIMGETEKQREEVIKDFLEMYVEEVVEPVIREFLKPIKKALKEIEKELDAENYKARDEYRTVEREVRDTQLLIWKEYKELQNILINKYTDKTDKLVKHEIQEIEDIDEEIEELKLKIEELEERKSEKEEEIEEEIGLFREEIRKIEADLDLTDNKLYDKRKLFLDPAEKIKSQIIEILDAQWELYQKEMKDFESRQRGKFGSYLKSLEIQFQDSLDSEQIPIYFSVVESDPNVNKQLAYLLTQPKLLLEENKSCLSHPKPVFREANLLQKSVETIHFEDTKNNPDLSKFRNDFSDLLKESLKDLMKKKLEVEPVTIDMLIEIPEEYTQELIDFVKDARERVPKEAIPEEEEQEEGED